MILVLLPGMDGTGTLFKPFVARLGSRFQVRVVHYPTTKPLGYPDLEAVARAELPQDGPFIILAESFSGPIAVSLAAACPPRLKGLVLCASFVRNPRPFFSGFRSLASAFPVRIAPTAVLSHFLLGPYATGELRGAFSQAIAQVSPAVFRARLHAVLTADVSEKFSSLTVPVMDLRAAYDRVVPRSASELMSQLNPHIRVFQIEGPHFLLQAAPAAAAQAVDAFVADVVNAL
ncbi:MAG: alpha/beta fold hydrolase [Deltaproteobacteria bacterium]|jgi:pimeloyl-ACP methyl ester carboxylesterase